MKPLTQETLTPEQPTELHIFTEAEMENIRMFKLTTGETIVAVLNGQDTKNRLAVIRRPCKLHSVQNDGSTQIAYVLTKWTIFCKSDMHLLDMNQIVITYPVNKEMVLFYIKSVRAQILEEIEEAKGPKEPTFNWPDWMDKEGVVKN